MIRATLILWLAMACAGIGNLFFSKGMQTIGPLNGWHPLTLLRFAGKSAANIHIWLGIVTSTAYFFLWLAVLSWADVSWALPMNAVEYAFVAMAAAVFLKEKVGVNRWIGIGLISVGIIFLMKSW